MAISSGQVTVTSTGAVALHSADNDGAYLYILNDGEYELYVGGATVTKSTGYLLEKDDEWQGLVGPNELLYGIASTDGNAKVYWLMTLNN